MRDWTKLVTEDGAVVLVAAEIEAASPSSFYLLTAEATQEKKKGFTMLLDSVFFQGIFSIPGALVAGFVIGTFLGSGNINLYNSLRLKRVLQQTRGQDIPRSVARSMTVSLCLSSILLAFGVLPFFGLLAGNVSVTGMIVNWWAVIFVATCGLVTLSVYITVFMARKRRERSLRLEGRGMEGEEQSARSRPLRQTARSHPQPKEASEEE